MNRKLTFLRNCLADVNLYAERLVRVPLLDYQRPIAQAISEAVLKGEGGVLTVEMPRQSGKNQISATCEAFFLLKHYIKGGAIIKVAPTFKPQHTISIRRIESILSASRLTRKLWKSRDGNTIEVGRAKEVFLSAQPGANVVGSTADIALIVDEAQEIDAEKFERDFTPMKAWRNAPLIAFGVPWNGETFLENLIAMNLELEKKDNVKRHFRVELEDVIKANPAYKRHFEHEVERFGKDHILIKTQYLLQSVSTLGDMFSPAQLALMRDYFPRKNIPSENARYFAGIDIGGSDFLIPGSMDRREHDETILVILEKSKNNPDEMLRLVNCFRWKNAQWETLHRELLILLDFWKCESVVVDGRGIGNACAMWLAEHYKKGVVEIYQASSSTISDDSYRLLSAAGLKHLKIFADSSDVSRVNLSAFIGRLFSNAADCLVSSDEIFRQLGNTKRELIQSGQIRFYVPEKYGHDDIVKAISYAIRAASSSSARQSNILLDAVTQ